VPLGFARFAPVLRGFSQFLLPLSVLISGCARPERFTLLGGLDGSVPSTGGATAAGGASTGGANAGGATSTGGVIGAGGTTGMGGAQGAGGVVSTGGTTSSGGKAGTGGVTATGGGSGTAGVTGIAGVTGTSGATGTGGAPGGGVVSFPFTPNNFDPTDYQPSVSSSSTVSLGCGPSTFDSETLAFGNWCGQFQPTPVILQQSGGPAVIVLPVTSLALAGGSSLRLTGSRPVLFAVFGNANIAGTIDASASGTTPGAGGNLSCGTSQGGNGSGNTARNDGASGGGGGGFGTPGGSGGRADTDMCCAGAGVTQPGGVAGVTRGTSGQSPLLGGCAGGMAGGCGTAGGAGGGAVQISAAGTLTVTGTVRSNGAAGALPCGEDDEGGGTGGGSGGGILLEGATLAMSGATLQANGGAGGPGGGYFQCGSKSTGATGATSASDEGHDAPSCVGGSPGGGGGYDRIQTLDR
jgi:hypothetical protein